MVQYHNTGISVLVGQDVRNTRHTIPNCYHVGMLRGMYCSNENDTYSVFRWSYTITTLTNSDLSSHFTEKTRHVWTSVFSFVEIVKSGDGQGRCFPLFFLIVQNVCFFILKLSCSPWLLRIFEIWWQCFRSGFGSVCLWVNCLPSGSKIGKLL